MCPESWGAFCASRLARPWKRTLARLIVKSFGIKTHYKYNKSSISWFFCAFLLRRHANRYHVDGLKLFILFKIRIAITILEFILKTFQELFNPYRKLPLCITNNPYASFLYFLCSDSYYLRSLHFQTQPLYPFRPLIIHLTISRTFCLASNASDSALLVLAFIFPFCPFFCKCLGKL